MLAKYEIRSGRKTTVCEGLYAGKSKTGRMQFYRAYKAYLWEHENGRKSLDYRVGAIPVEEVWIIDTTRKITLNRNIVLESFFPTYQSMIGGKMIVS